ncbi:DMT family transporter [Companilactobacillus pabuli]|jgi:Predicted permeases|uniref:DMT family transporter n=1 Tax=Companilactobacillus pabuli TaxID=2714036 RepID=A0A7L7KVI9_9LACO|nr:DMT family transporter [Companilactobacillus pabuli]AKP03233.1 membrane protein [Companilactobacillus farciminis]AKS51533.1 membrane protein [Companilactobacillus farciminis]QMT83306.1 DMT family transporter [Companilactobacillus pabuli]
MKSKRILGSVFLTIASIIWGAMFVVVKIIVDEVHPIQLVWLEYLIALVFLIGYSIMKREKWHINWPDLKLIFWIGIIGNTISLVAQEMGTGLSNAQTGSVITSTIPAFMIIFGWLILKEKLDKVKIFSVIIAILGVVMIVGLKMSGTNVILGVLLLVLDSIAWALMSVLVKKVKTYSSLQITIMSTVVAVVALTPFILSDMSSLTSINFLDPKVIWSLLYIGAVSTAVAYVMWNRGLQIVSAGSSGLFYLIQPIVGSFLGWLLLGEQISVGFVIGSALILASVWISVKYDGSSDEETQLASAGNSI